MDENEFELIFNIQSNDKIFFNNLTLSLPDDLIGKTKLDDLLKFAVNLILLIQLVKLLI